MPDQHPAPRRVAAVGISQDLAGLLADVLTMTGLGELETVALGASTAERLARNPPDLIILQVGPEERLLSLLDELRVDSQTAAVPVIVLASHAVRAVQARASGNVRAVLFMPFEIEDLEREIRDALSRQSFERQLGACVIEQDPSYQRASDVLMRVERQALLDWLRTLRQDLALTPRGALAEVSYLDFMPPLVNSLVLSLRHKVSPELLASDEDIQYRVCRHARERSLARVPLESVIREYQVIRQTLLRYLKEALPAEDALKAIEKLNALLDQVVAMTVTEYLRAS